MIAFDEYGYLDHNRLSNDDTYNEVKQAIEEKIKAVSSLIEVEQLKLSQLQNKLSCLEHSNRTVWLLFDPQTNKLKSQKED